MKHLAPPSGRHRAPVRPRYGRIGVALSAVVVTAVAVLGGAGVLPGDDTDAAGAASLADAVTDPEAGAREDAGVRGSAEEDAAEETVTPGDGAENLGRGGDRRLPLANSTTVTAPLPTDSGDGVRIVFSEGEQRVWLVDDTQPDADAEGVFRSYPVSGSVYDNLEPGTYEVYSRSRHAIGIDDSGTMEYFVRFTQGTQGAAIGFHTIPVADGEPVQTRRQLGTPLSHGCIRQARADAIALWDFAPLGTTVVVTA